jgi:hypothetical protein
VLASPVAKAALSFAGLLAFIAAVLGLFVLLGGPGT